jgi:hypothetical protein
MWMMSDLLHTAGVSVVVRRLLFRMGIGMEPSHIPQRQKKMIAAHAARINRMLGEVRRCFVLIADDFNAFWRRKLPAKTSWSDAANITNAILKEMDVLADELRADQFAGIVVPLAFCGSEVAEIVSDLWTADNVRPYEECRLPELEAASFRVAPYSNREDETATLDMCGVHFLDSFADPFKGQNICKTLASLSRRLAPVLRDHYMFVTGDYYLFRYVMHLMTKFPAEFGHFIPIPGPFHIGLNAQEGVFAAYWPVIARLWRETFPEKAAPCVKDPVERKYVLDMLQRAWNLCGNECLTMVRSEAEWPIEVTGLVSLFTEHLPLSVDLHSCFLAGTLNGSSVASTPHVLAVWQASLRHNMHLYARPSAEVAENLPKAVCSLSGTLQGDQRRAY